MLRINCFETRRARIGFFCVDNRRAREETGDQLGGYYRNPGYCLQAGVRVWRKGLREVPAKMEAQEETLHFCT